VGRMSIKDELKRLRLEHRHDIAADGREAVDKFKILINQGYIFDFIFMDIYLPEMGGVDATKAIRNIESSYNVHSNIVAVTVEGKKDLEQGIFDEYCKNYKIFNY
jgi:two-component system sensor histidine kinase BarA